MNQMFIFVFTSIIFTVLIIFIGSSSKKNKKIIINEQI